MAPASASQEKPGTSILPQNRTEFWQQPNQTWEQTAPPPVSQEEPRLADTQTVALRDASRELRQLTYRMVDNKRVLF